MGKIGLLSEKNQHSIKKVRKSLLLAAIWTLLTALAVGVVSILVWDGSFLSGDFARVMGTFALLALALFVSVNNLFRLEKNGKIIQASAITALVCNMIWLVFGILLMWNILPSVTQVCSGGGYLSVPVNGTLAPDGFHCDYYDEAYQMIFQIAAAIAAAGFWISNVLSLDENTKIIKPLKYASAICAVYVLGFTIYVIISHVRLVDGRDRFMALSSFAQGMAVVTAIVAWAVSMAGRKKSVAAKETDTKANIHAEITGDSRQETSDRVAHSSESVNTVKPVPTEVADVVNVQREVLAEARIDESVDVAAAKSADVSSADKKEPVREREIVEPARFE